MNASEFNREPLRMKPHHIEGAQRALIIKKNVNHLIMLDMLEKKLAEDPDTELIFVKDFDAFCKRECLEPGKPAPCNELYGSMEAAQEIDVEVAREHGWEFEKPYKIRDILDELKKEVLGREIFYINKLTREQYEQWLRDIRASKERAKAA